MQIYNSFSGYRNADFRMQECRSITFSQEAGMTVLSLGIWGTHSFALSFQTQQQPKIIKFLKWFYYQK
jgi:hypothetical protein